MMRGARILGFSLVLLTLGVLPARAELEEEGDLVLEEVIAKPQSKSKPKPRPKPKARATPKPAIKMPAAPIPYAQLKTDVKAALPATASPSPKVSVAQVAPPVATALPPVVHAAPPVAYAAPLPPPVDMIPATTHDLKCETQVVGPKGLVSKGSFYLEVSLSDVFPDDTAGFKMAMADPRHESLLKDTACETIRCRVTISPNFYDLYNARTKRGAQLRATLDRHTGAYLARKLDGQPGIGPVSLPGGKGLGAYEEGYCVPQTRTAKLF